MIAASDELGSTADGSASGAAGRSPLLATTSAAAEFVTKSIQAAATSGCFDLELMWYGIEREPVVGEGVPAAAPGNANQPTFAPSGLNVPFSQGPVRKYRPSPFAKRPAAF